MPLADVKPYLKRQKNDAAPQADKADLAVTIARGRAARSKEARHKVGSARAGGDQRRKLREVVDEQQTRCFLVAIGPMFTGHAEGKDWDGEKGRQLPLQFHTVFLGYATPAMSG
jgi:hypothetical protein